MKSIKMKTWLYLMILIGIILGMMWLLQVVFLQNFYEISKEQDVKKIQKTITQVMSQEDIIAGYEKVLDLSAHNELFVEIYNEKGEMVLNPYMFINTQSFLENRPPISEFYVHQGIDSIIETMTRENKESNIVRVKDRKSNISAIVLTNKITNNGNSYYVVTKASLMPVQATSDILKKIFVIILFFILAVSLIVAFVLSTSVTRPLRRLSEAAKTVAAGDYNVTLPVYSKDELGQLMLDFNYMTQELNKVDEIRKDLIANVSHELRTPLTMIKGYAETIKDITGNQPEKREKQLDIIIDETDRLSYLISNMLDLSQLQAGKIEFDKRDIDVSKMIKRVLKQYEIFQDQGYRINTSIAQDVHMIGDEGRFEQVIYNLVDNAINHSVEHKEIDVTLSGGSNPEIRIHNMGDAIPKEDLPHIWDRYYKIDKTGNRRVTGTGIGLSIVKEILTAHKLQFGVESTQEAGTTFWIRLGKSL